MRQNENLRAVPFVWPFNIVIVINGR